MRKSLGEKRKTITDEQIAEITQLYNEATDHAETDKRAKIFTREDFGFQRITVEQPLRRIWRVGDGDAAQTFSDEKAAKKNLAELNPDADTKTINALLKAAATTDPDGPIALDKKGNPQSDPDLRDQENIPLPAGWLDLNDATRTQALIEQADAYLESDIKPYAPEAWIDHDKTKIGYEIPFTRHFYEYVPPRPLEEIDAELLETEKRIQELLGGLKA
jgi:type I restriction enzyme M protein